MTNQGTVINVADRTCPQCKGRMAQIGSERGIVMYKCKSCGYSDSIVLSADNNVEYWHKRSQLLSRVRLGVSQWETTRWDVLLVDVQKFMASYEDARRDIYFTVAHIACMTNGFHSMDSEKYKKCKQMFKITERIYKIYLKEATRNFSKETGNEGFTNYEEYRALYKSCRSAYRNEKILWKVVFFFTKKIIPVPKL